MKNINIVCLGDSITYGYGVDEKITFVYRLDYHLKNKYPEYKINVINSGINGDTTREAIKRIDYDVLSFKPNIVILLLGSNDSGYNEFSHVSLWEYENNLISIICKIKQTGSHVILITPPPIDDEEAMPFYSCDAVKKYGLAAKKIAYEYDCDVIDFFNIAINKTNNTPAEILQCDGLHLNYKGYDMLYNEILKLIELTIKKGV